MSAHNVLQQLPKTRSASEDDPGSGVSVGLHHGQAMPICVPRNDGLLIVERVLLMFS